MNNLIDRLQDKDDKKAYHLAKQIIIASAAGDEYYPYFADFLSMIKAESSYVRTRGFILCCAQARWDNQGKLENALDEMLVLLHDKKPTVVRQCLAALCEVVLFIPELSDKVKKEVDQIDLTAYKDTMTPLIKKDIAELRKVLN
ncbi:MAG: hypothetical protein ACI4WG_07370 [Erysipelotrichaceae bacterium]